MRAQFLGKDPDSQVDNSPTLFVTDRTDRRTYIAQGWKVTDPQVLADVGPEHIYPTVHDAATALSPEAMQDGAATPAVSVVQSPATASRARHRTPVTHLVSAGAAYELSVTCVTSGPRAARSAPETSAHGVDQ